MANEYLRECHALCFIENRKGISQIYRNIEEFIQFIYFLAKLGIKIQLLWPAVGSEGEDYP